MALLIDTSLQQLEQLLEDALSIALKKRKKTIADVATLRSTPSRASSGGPLWKTGDLVYCTAAGNCYRWKQASTDADDGELVLKPDDTTAAATGRWLKVITGMLIDGVNAATIEQPPVAVKSVILHNGDFSPEVLKERIYGQAPCVAIHFAGEGHSPLSGNPGALYDYRVKFDLWSVSRNYRDRFEAALGSDIPAETIDDPGVLRIHGAVKKAVAGKSGQDDEKQIDDPSVKYIEIHDGELIESELAERVFVMSLGTEVLASIHNPDPPVTRNPLSGVNVQRELADAPGPSQFDLDNCVRSGLEVPSGMSLTATIGNGSAIVSGAPTLAPSLVHTFGADCDTWRELKPDGTWIFHQVAHEADQPVASTGNLMVGVTVTDPAGVVADRITCSLYQDYPGPDTPDIDLV